jgi:hypothetical protein
VLTHPTGTILKPIFDAQGKSKNCAEGGTCLTATNVGNAILTTDPTDGSAPTVLSECNKVVITGSLTKNNGTEFEGDITTATFSGNGAAFDGMNECKGLGGFGDLTPTTNGKHAEKTGGVPVKTDNEELVNGTPWCIASAANDKFTVRGGTCAEAARPIVFILNSTLGGECKMEKATAVEGTFTTHSTGDAILTLVAGAGTTFKKVSGGVLCPGTGTLDMTFTMETDNPTPAPIYIS